MKALKYEDLNIKPYKRNAKKHPDGQLQALAKSLREFGWVQPIVIDKKDEIVIGHGRYLAYKTYPDGIKSPWVVRAEDLNPNQIKALRLVDNKLNESGWDMDLVIEELKELSPEMLDLTGFDESLLTIEQINELEEWKDAGMENFDLPDRDIKIILYFKSEEERENYALEKGITKSNTKNKQWIVKI